MYHTLQDIIKTKGTAGLYVGIRISLFQTFCSNFGYFWFYALVRKVYFKYFKTKNTGIELLLGAVAGGLARAFTTPISVITTRMQVSDKDKTYTAIAKEIVEKEGIFGLWRGFGASLVLTINPAITYGLYQRLNHYVVDAKSTFLIGALTKSLATICSTFESKLAYPYILIKTRLQADERYKGVLDCGFKTLKMDGIFGLYSGMHSQLFKAVLCQALLFLLKESLTKSKKIK